MRTSATIELFGYIYGQPENPIADKYPNFIKFSLSVSRKWKDKNGQEKEECTWYECQSWTEGLSKMIKNNVKGGMGLLVKGTPRCKAYIDKEGQAKGQIEVSIKEINMLTFPTEKNVENEFLPVTDENSLAANDRSKIEAKPVIAEVTDLADDDIPF